MKALHRALRDQRLFRAPAIRMRMLLRPGPRTIGGVLFLVYHRMAAQHRAAFDRQLRLLRGFGDLVGLPDALAVLAAPPKADMHICLTFDDGWADAARHAAPVLAANGAPATLFVVSDWVGRPHRVTWDELRTLHAAGLTVGSHSMSHARLAGLSEAEARRELHQSRAAIARQVGGPCDHFAAPFGQPGEDFLRDRDPVLAREAGYTSFFTTVPRRALSGTDRFALPRIRMEPHWGRDEIAYALWR